MMKRKKEKEPCRIIASVTLRTLGATPFHLFLNFGEKSNEEEKNIFIQSFVHRQEFRFRRINDSWSVFLFFMTLNDFFPIFSNDWMAAAKFSSQDDSRARRIYTQIKSRLCKHQVLLHIQEKGPCGSLRKKERKGERKKKNSLGSGFLNFGCPFGFGIRRMVKVSEVC